MRSSLEDLVWQTTSQLDILRPTRATLIGLGAECPPDAPQRLSVQQIGDVDMAELRADPRLWVAYERGWREHARAAPASPLAPTDRRPILGPVRHTQRTVKKATTAPTAKPQPRPARQPPPARVAQGPTLASAPQPVHRRPSQQQRRKPLTVQPATAQPRAQLPTARPRAQLPTARPRTQLTAVQPWAQPPSVPPRTQPHTAQPTVALPPKPPATTTLGPGHQPPIREQQPETPVEAIPQEGSPTVDEDACQAPPPAFVSHKPMEVGGDEILVDIKALYRE
ncbi:translation initiation factor IF-2-like [Aphis gossypii]|uniref:translation initiation factor IF-2-like n=1 Tax=Aphis gossypii TaxID=80765 RepID=UPI002158E336|nr:translation initiation factor IF-2-like [Aphis gossypii]